MGLAPGSGGAATLGDGGAVIPGVGDDSASFCSAAMRPYTKCCCPSVQQLLLTKYSRIATGANAPKAITPTGNTHNASLFMIAV